MNKWLIRIVVGLAVAVVVIIPVTWMVASELPDPANRYIEASAPGLQASNVTFVSGSGALIHGWLSRGEPGQGVVLLLHGLRGDRRDMLSRAQFLRARGYSVLLFDFQAHGESRGQRVTFGDLEAQDVTAALQYLRHKMPDEKVGIVGVSLGAAAFVLAEDRLPVAAVVLEQMYSTLEQAVAIRVRPRVGPFARLFAPLLMAEMQSRLKIPENRLRPIDRMGTIGAPVLVVDGLEDNYTPIDDARAQLSAAPPPKQLWAVERAGHVNLHTFAKPQYEQRVGDFLGQYLPRAAGALSPLTK